MEGKIVAAYQTSHGVCYINDAAYSGRSAEDRRRVEHEISATVRSILERIVNDGGEPYDQLMDRIERRQRGEIQPAAVPIPIPEVVAYGR